MNKRNCPNCGAPYDMELNKCPYCGTSYYDLSSLDFTNNEPFYMKIKINNNGHIAYVTQLVRPVLKDILITDESVYAYDGRGTRLYNVRGSSITTNVEFEALRDVNKNECVRIEVI